MLKLKEVPKYILQIILICFFVFAIVPKSFQNDTFFTIACRKSNYKKWNRKDR